MLLVILIMFGLCLAIVGYLMIGKWVANIEQITIYKSYNENFEKNLVLGWSAIMIFSCGITLIIVPIIVYLISNHSL